MKLGDSNRSYQVAAQHWYVVGFEEGRVLNNTQQIQVDIFLIINLGVEELGGVVLGMLLLPFEHGSRLHDHVKFFFFFLFGLCT
jgi:hypothetical protein